MLKRGLLLLLLIILLVGNQYHSAAQDSSVSYEEVLRIDTESLHTTVVWHPDGEIFASAIDGTETYLSLFIWNADGELLHHLQGFSGVKESLAWSPDGRFLATTTHVNQVRIWDAETWEEAYLLSMEDVAKHEVFGAEDVKSLAWHPNGDRIAILSQSDVYIWTISTNSVDAILREGEIQSIAWSADGTQIAGGENNGRVRIWDADTLETLLTLTPEIVYAMHGWFHGKLVAWHPTDMRLAIVSNLDYEANNYVYIRDMANEGKLLATLTGHDAYIYMVVWSPDGLKLASSSRDGTIRIWDATNYELLDILEAHEGGVVYVTWSPDSRQLITSGHDNTLRIWAVVEEE